tara:strand:+ start:1170 stop:3080 length:1911 start_codon:yes stop_codon:yes gene_type:complete
MVTSQQDSSVVEQGIDFEAADRLDEPEITMSWINGKIEQGNHEFREFRNQCELADEFFLNNFEFSAPDAGTMIRLGTAQSVINTLVSHVKPQFLDISVPPPGPRGQARAELMEKFLTGAHHMVEQKSPVHRELTKHAGLYGVAWEKVEFVANEWSDFPEPPPEETNGNYRNLVKEVLEKRSVSWPIKTVAVNPQSLLWDTNNNTTPRWVISETEVDAQWVQAHFPDWNHHKKGYVKFREIWTHSQVAYVADGKWAMEPRKHGYKRLPWVMYWPQMGLQTTELAPEDLYKGILNGSFDMLKAQSQLASHYIDIVAKSAWPTLEFTGPLGITEEVQSRWDDTPGAKNIKPPQVAVQVSETPRPPSEIGIAKEFLDEAIEANTVPAVARGQRPTGAASGYHTAVLAGIASLNFGAVKDAMERGMQDKGEVILQIIENVIRDRVTVFGKTEAGTLDATIKPSDINGHYVNIVRINSVSPEEQERRLNLWSNLWRAGYVDLDTALRKGGVANPLEVRAKILEEKFLAAPEIQQQLQLAAASRIPTIQNILQAAQGGGDSEAEQVAQNILNTQGAQQLPNPGNFSGVNQPPRMNEAARVMPSTRPVMPGSIQEMNQVGAAIAGPRSGNVRVPAADISPGARG